MMKKLIVIGSLFIAVLTGCGETSRESYNDNNSEKEHQVISNGIHTLSLQSGDTKIFAFNMSEDGYVSIETEYYKCNIDLINSDGEIIKSTASHGGSINPNIKKGLYYLKVKSRSDNCNSFVLFSPMIIDDNTNENREIITNGTHRL